MGTRKKYELTGERSSLDGRTLYRIRAVRNFGGVRKGDLGGFVEGERNLSHAGRAWVADDARVAGNARVVGDALVGGDATLCDRAVVADRALVDGNAWVTGDARISGSVLVTDDARVGGNAVVTGAAVVRESAAVSEFATVAGTGDVSGHAEVTGRTCVIGPADICGRAMVRRTGDYMTVRNAWSSGGWITCFRTARGGLEWKEGTFLGTGKGLVRKAYRDSRLSGDCHAAVVAMAERVFAATADAYGRMEVRGGWK